MPGRPFLSTEAEREEAEDRARLRELDLRLRELNSERNKHIELVRSFSDRQRESAGARSAKQDLLERVHSDHRELGTQLSKLRTRRDKARQRIDKAIVALREVRQNAARPEMARPELIEREMEKLEMHQQTHALPLAEENALISHLRELRKSLEAARAGAREREGFQARLKAAEEELRLARAEADGFQKESDRLRTTRERAMTSLRAHLEEAGRLYAEVRELSRQRGTAMAKVDDLSRDMNRFEREARGLLARSRARREEARKTLREFSGPRRDRARQSSAADEVAEDRLEELLKAGRISLG